MYVIIYYYICGINFKKGVMEIEDLRVNEDYLLTEPLMIIKFYGMSENGNMMFRHKGQPYIVEKQKVLSNVFIKPKTPNDLALSIGMSVVDMSFYKNKEGNLIPSINIQYAFHLIYQKKGYVFNLLTK